MAALNAAGVKKWIALSEGAAGGVGWLTTNERKEAMAFQLRDALRVGAIGIWHNFKSITSTAQETLKVLKDELSNFCILVEAPRTPFGKPKRTYSGKVGGRNDDLCICLQLAITGCR